MSEPPMRPYTDDDVKAVAAVIKLALDYRYTDPADIAASVLHTVAAAIAVRTLRDAAEWLVESMTCGPERAPDTHCDAIRQAAGELRWRADEIERT